MQAGVQGKFSFKNKYLSIKVSETYLLWGVLQRSLKCPGGNSLTQHVLAQVLEPGFAQGWERGWRIGVHRMPFPCTARENACPDSIACPQSNTGKAQDGAGP